MKRKKKIKRCCEKLVEKYRGILIYDTYYDVSTRTFNVYSIKFIGVSIRCSASLS
jgi:ribosomal protein S17E